MAVTKLYRNTSDVNMVVPGIGEVPAGGQVSITSEYPPAVVLQNFPGLVDITNESNPQPQPSQEAQNV